MKIEKVKRYNQRILAILGTLAIILVISAIIGIGGITIAEFSRFNRSSDVEEGILSNEKIEELQKESKREQVVSFQTPRLVDTINSIYIIPVAHKNLNEVEDINTLSAFKSRDYKSEDHRYSREYYGAFNNVIVYDQKDESTKKLFENRVNFNFISTEYFADDIILLFKVSEKDTFKDGVINLLDFKSLYHYSLKEKKLKKIGIENMDVDSFKFLNQSKDLVITFGIDKNKDGKFEDYNEPTIIKKYDYSQGKLIDIIEEELSSELQKTLEGTKN